MMAQQVTRGLSETDKRLVGTMRTRHRRTSPLTFAFFSQRSNRMDSPVNPGCSKMKTMNTRK